MQEAERVSQNIHEETDDLPATATQDYDPFSTESLSRPPLGEIHNNTTPLSESERKEQLLPTKKIKGSRHGIAGQTENVDLILANDENCAPRNEQKMLEHRSQYDASSTGEAAEIGLTRDAAAGETSQIPIDAARLKTPSSVAARETSIPLSRSPGKKAVPGEFAAVKMPRFDPAVHSEKPYAGRAADQGNEDSFVGSITTRTPARSVESEVHTGDGPDSFVEDITSRSPSKHMARIEDSVEALDALEEAIEQVAEEIPKAIAGNLESPVKTRTSPATTTVRESTKKASPNQATSGAAAPARQPEKNTEPTTRNGSERNKTRAPNHSISGHATPRVSSFRPKIRPSITRNAKVLSSPQLTASSAATAKSPQPAANTTAAAPTKRTTTTNLSTSKPGFVPTKSAKPPTRSTFSLPGDAIAAKMKAQREERLKKEEEAAAEAARKRTEFKARPVPKTMTAGSRRGSGGGSGGKGRISSVLPRETLASRARMSLMAARKDEEGKENAGAVTKKKIVSASGLDSVRVGSVARKSVVPSLATIQSGSLSVTKTRRAPPPSTAKANVNVTSARANKSKIIVPANSSAIRKNTSTYPAPLPKKTRPSSLLQSTTTTGPLLRSRSDPTSSTKLTTVKAAAATTISGVTSGTAKGKEVFSRGKIAEEDLLKQKREKEEAAKKARVQAAERGRLASREWAEKQRKKRETMVGMAEGKKEEGRDGNGVAKVEVEGGKEG